ncbi:hypothetical protein AB0B12_32295 [Streptomyces sp. NPDC044780]|uniref:hypothetical protein n=1 Tax=unclassified Streptomyces TaxID=2593676 RepID=UPI0033F697FE
MTGEPASPVRLRGSSAVGQDGENSVGAFGAGCAYPQPTRFWLSDLPDDTPIAELVRLAKIRWRIEHELLDRHLHHLPPTPAQQNHTKIETD